ncbi:MAG: TfoX/Sxy family protein [Desulfobacteraceae bacterium]|jgi:TfoX/Sxy family transcriptional regulator of competence genes
MPYNKQIETRIKKMISSWKNTDHKSMFGGVCHLLNGNMFCGVYKDFLILRLGEENGNKALALPHVRPFDITGKPMKGWVMVEQDGFRADHDLASWLNQAREFASSLPPK